MAVFFAVIIQTINNKKHYYRKTTKKLTANGAGPPLDRVGGRLIVEFVLLLDAERGNDELATDDGVLAAVPPGCCCPPLALTTLCIDVRLLSVIVFDDMAALPLLPPPKSGKYGAHTSTTARRPAGPIRRSSANNKLREASRISRHRSFNGEVNVNIF